MKWLDVDITCLFFYKNLVRKKCSILKMTLIENTQKRDRLKNYNYKKYLKMFPTYKFLKNTLNNYV